MIVQITSRAEIAIRSLGKQEQLRIGQAIKKLETTSRIDLQSSLQIRKLNNLSNLFVFRATERIRFLLSFEGEHCNIEDVVTPDQLSKVIGYAE